MGNTWISRGWIKAGMIRLASYDSLLHSIVNIQNDSLSLVLPTLRFILALKDREGFHDIIDVIMSDAVEMEVRRIKFATQQKAAFYVPAKWRPGIATIFGEGC
jgi:hypothetical protein